MYFTGLIPQRIQKTMRGDWTFLLLAHTKCLREAPVRRTPVCPDLSVGVQCFLALVKLQSSNTFPVSYHKNSIHRFIKHIGMKVSSGIIQLMVQHLRESQKHSLPYFLKFSWPAFSNLQVQQLLQFCFSLYSKNKCPTLWYIILISFHS